MRKVEEGKSAAMNTAQRLYEWIVVANEARERLDLPPGAIEDAISVLQKAFGNDYLDALLPSDDNPLKRFVTADEDEPLAYWLAGPGIDKSVDQVLETAAVIGCFLSDPCLEKKIERMKSDSFWPFFYELAMASRVKRALGASGSVLLSSEVDENNGDFIVKVDGGEIICECARLVLPPTLQEGTRVTQDIFDYVADKVRGRGRRQCVKIRVAAALSRNHFNPVVALLKRALEKYEKTGESVTASSSPEIEVVVEPLNELTEQFPFAEVDGKIVDVAASGWTHATRIGDAIMEASTEIATMFRQGEHFDFHEHTRVLVGYAQPEEPIDPYTRLRDKLKSKVAQTKTSVMEKTAKFVWIDSPYDPRTLDHNRLRDEAIEAMRRSSHTLGAVYTHREGTPHFRHQYSLFGIPNPKAEQSSLVH